MLDSVLFIHFREFLLHGRVPVVLYRVVSAAVEVLGHLGPAVAEALVGQEEEPLLEVLPVVLLDVGVEMVVPAFPALLADPS